MGSCGFVGTEFVSKDEKVLKIGCTTKWIYLKPQNCILKID